MPGAADNCREITQLLRTGCSSRGEDPFSHHFILVVFPGGKEAQAAVEALRPVLVWVVAHGQPVLSTAHGLLAQGFDCEPPVAFALMLGADVQAPQVALE